MKKWSHLSFSMLPELWSLNCPKKCIFCNFVLISVINLSLLKQFTYMYLKNLNKDFQKMFWFMGVWATVHEILAIRISKKMLTQQKFTTSLGTLLWSCKRQLPLIIWNIRLHYAVVFVSVTDFPIHTYKRF